MTDDCAPNGGPYPRRYVGRDGNGVWHWKVEYDIGAEKPYVYAKGSAYSRRVAARRATRHRRRAIRGLQSRQIDWQPALLVEP